MNLPTKIKLLACISFLVGAAIFALFSPLSFAQKKSKSNEKPNISLIDKFDSAIQQRFLTEPYFGIRRIQPNYLVNPHISEYFQPKDDAEKSSVAAFQNEDWKVGLYLFGRVIKEAENIKDSEPRFTIMYRPYNPVIITNNIQSGKLKPSADLLKKVKDIFLELQNSDSYEFNSGEWSYVARPVRAQESCLKCHTDYVMTEKLGGKSYKFRKKQAGDVNGVIVYGFAKAK